jgi:hypothetical protein
MAILTGMEMQVYNLSTWEAEVGGLRVWDQFGLHGKLNAAWAT